MSAGKREDHCLVLCATYDGEGRARGRGIGAQERDDPGNIPLELRRASPSCSRTRRPTMTLYREAKLGRDFFPGDRARLIAAANLFQQLADLRLPLWRLGRQADRVRGVFTHASSLQGGLQRVEWLGRRCGQCRSRSAATSGVAVRDVPRLDEGLRPSVLHGPTGRVERAPGRKTVG
jgi:hypothetical protein